MTYAALFAAIGTSHGSGAGGTTFNLPDYRGRFLRGVDNPTGGAPAGRDPDAAGRAAAATGGNAGNAVGSMQAQATSKNGLVLSDPGHSHNLIINGNVQAFAYGDGAVSTSNYFRYANGGNGNFGTLSIQPGSSNTSLGNGDSETRPINAYVNYVIKY
jgi:microcystin-dependent protein